MPAQRFLVVTDTPGIKHFVFGTDALAEVRGASGLLDRLNRQDTEPQLRQHLPAEADCETVFVNGGTGQFVLRAPSQEAVERALNALARFYRDRTGGEVRLVWAVVPWPEGTPYREAAHEAHFQMRLLRETAAGHPSTPLLPFLLECASTSHLPARPEPERWGGENLMLSDAAVRKRAQARQAGEAGPWADWMQHLQQGGPWPGRTHWYALRARETVLPESARKSYVGLVYADGNAMGRFVQELDSTETCRAFSTIVDGSVRTACYQALDAVCSAAIERQRNDRTQIHSLPADILLLGGDDLLVLLPADRALDFALSVTAAFEEATRRRISELPRGDTRRFFEKHLEADRGLTLSCGVALAPAKYPFYLLFDLAEELLRSAKQGGSRDPDRGMPSYIDFHLVVGPAGADLPAVREDDYLVGSTQARTLRPYRRDRLECLRRAVVRLHEARLPRSRLHDFWEAALDPRPARAEMHARELFGRLRAGPTHDERQALWLALQDLNALTDFPWCLHNGRVATALADLVEACDLFPREDLP